MIGVGLGYITEPANGTRGEYGLERPARFWQDGFVSVQGLVDLGFEKDLMNLDIILRK
jgi:hypothetical protein